MNSTGFGSTAQLLMVLFIVLTLGTLWVWALVDSIRSEFANSTNKIIWVLVIMFLPLLGALLYLFIGREQKLKA